MTAAACFSTAPLLAEGVQPQTAVTFRQAETKRRAVRVLDMYRLHVACFCTSALFYCSHTVAFVLVAWCRTYHERSLCLLRVWAKSCPVARIQLLERDTTATTQLAQLNFLFPPTHSWDISLERAWATCAFSACIFSCFARCYTTCYLFAFCIAFFYCCASAFLRYGLFATAAACFSTAPLLAEGLQPQTAVTFRQAETKRRAVRVLDMYRLHVACFCTSALFYCSHTVAFVLVAWCRTYHEPRVLIESYRGVLEQVHDNVGTSIPAKKGNNCACADGSVVVQAFVLIRFESLHSVWRCE